MLILSRYDILQRELLLLAAWFGLHILAFGEVDRVWLERLAELLGGACDWA